MTGMVESSPQLEISCESCGARVVVEASQRTARCPYCDSPSVIDRRATVDRPDPKFTIGFSVDRKQAGQLVRSFLGRKKTAPFGLKRAVAEKVHGVYVPAYLFSALAVSRYAARIGEDYWVTVVSRDSKGGTKVRRERRTEDRSLQGSHRTYLGDVLVTASRGISNNEIEAIEPYRLEELRLYRPGLVAGWVSEEPTLSWIECLSLARRESVAKVGRMLRAFMPGDSVRSLEHETEFEQEGADLTLLPVWVFAMRFVSGKPPVRVLVNGQTGQVWGRIPISWAKIGLVAAVVLGLLAVPALIAIILGLFS